MSNPPPRALILVKQEYRTLSPTGWALLQLVIKQGDRMLWHRRHGRHEDYLEEKAFYLELLEIAQSDVICAPILINHVQRVLDAEAAQHRAGFDKP